VTIFNTADLNCLLILISGLSWAVSFEYLFLYLFFACLKFFAENWIANILCSNSRNQIFYFCRVCWLLLLLFVCLVIVFSELV
jgi:hypothetical protein